MTISDNFPEDAIDASVRMADASPAFSICTLVTNPVEYREVVESFASHGFGHQDCEYLYLDNSRGNRFDAYRGYNLFLSVARGEFIILCHQDILLLGDDRNMLERRLSELTAHDPDWGLCGNAGGRFDGTRAVRISDPKGEDRNRGPFPARVMALDENFIVVRRDANLALSHDLFGFHFYGADLCTIADIIGRSAYVIDFHLRHKSGGTVDERFYALQRAFVAKYQKAFRSRWMTTACASVPLAGSPTQQKLLLFQRRLANVKSPKDALRLMVRAFTAGTRRLQPVRREDQQTR
jgi:hypothetical protein